MCGRFALTARPAEVESAFGVAEVEDFPPRYNIAPTQAILTITGGVPRAPGANLPDRKAMLVRWGFIPAWAKNPGDLPLLINARSETAAEKAAFRAAMRHRRALVPATGFYEWRRQGRARAQPFWVRPRHGGVIAFAGLTETWCEPGGSEIDTGAILTTAASPDLADIHHRMPVVIQPENIARWLDCLHHEPRMVADLLAPPEPGFFEAVPVSEKVNKVANAGPEIQEPADPAAKPVVDNGPAGQLQLF
ncbi:SOS response-associated peptidase [Chelativorans sp. M5D2P16]|uniref:SOS response-associated peptidase n=1 Tax=Chelativorans sp. M5D2P16 TaxID=3095678 RepID=UPI002ACA7E77|nr:SOS response-associated peptidase [Chelativorans sp. M5D2P16]MDZ5696258.1 SOS response-associated peptidase [Chelativorans sp. M5D2P16]